MVCASVRSVASAAVLGMVALGSLLSSSGAHAAPLRANSAATVGDRAPTGHATWAAAALEELNVVSDAAVADIDAPAPLVYVEVTPPARVMHNNNVERRQLPTAGQTVADSTAYQTQPGMTYPSASVYVVMPNMDLGFGVVPTPPRDNVPSGKGPNDAVVAMINAATQGNSFKFFSGGLAMEQGAAFAQGLATAMAMGGVQPQIVRPRMGNRAPPTL